MKLIKSWYLALWVTALFLIGWLLFSRPIHAQSRLPGPPHQVVIMRIYEAGANLTDGRGQRFQYDGLHVYVSSSSEGAPQFPQLSIPSVGEPTIDAAKAFSILLDAGFVLQPGRDSFQFVWIKN